MCKPPIGYLKKKKSLIVPVVPAKKLYSCKTVIPWYKTQLRKYIKMEVKLGGN